MNFAIRNPIKTTIFLVMVTLFAFWQWPPTEANAIVVTASAGTITTSHTQIPESQIDVYTLTCTSHASAGTVTATITDMEGMLLRVVTDPGSPAPDDNWDFTLSDANGIDVCATEGNNRSTSSSQDFCPFVGDGTNYIPTTLQGTLTLAASNMNNSKAAVFKFYLKRL